MEKNILSHFAINSRSLGVESDDERYDSVPSPIGVGNENELSNEAENRNADRERTPSENEYETLSADEARAENDSIGDAEDLKSEGEIVYFV